MRTARGPRSLRHGSGEGPPCGPAEPPAPGRHPCQATPLGTGSPFTAVAPGQTPALPARPRQRHGPWRRPAPLGLRLCPASPPAPGLELCPLGPRGLETRCFLPSAEPAPGLAVLAGPVQVPPPHPGGGRRRCVLSAEPTAQLGGASHVPGAELPVCARAPSSSRAGSAVATPAALPPAHPVGDRDAPGVC